MVARGGSAPLVANPTPPPPPSPPSLPPPRGVGDTRVQAKPNDPPGVRRRTEVLVVPRIQGCRATPGNLQASLRDAGGALPPAPRSAAPFRGCRSGEGYPAA